MPPFDFATLAAGLLAGVLLTALFAWALQRGRDARKLAEGRRQRDAELAEATTERRSLEQRLLEAASRNEDSTARERVLQAQLSQAVAERARVDERMRQLEEAAAERGALRGDRDRLTAELATMREQAAELGARLEAAGMLARERLALVEGARVQLKETFQVLAGEILEDKTRRFTEQNQQQLGSLLDPLREQLKDFRETVSKTYASEQHERGALAHEIRSLRELNVRISEDATSLTRALRGDQRTQGAWGELVLEKLLEASGLEAGREYELQASFSDGDGGRPRPDVIVRLPEQKDVVIDAKVSLVAYERYCNATDEVARATALAEHCASVRRHVDGLSGKNYAGLEGLRTLDFVLMFVPIEGAFSDAVRADPDMYAWAIARNVTIVTPSTLLATLRTIAYLWRIERQNVNAQEIAKRAAQLHDNFALLATELEAVGAALEKATAVHATALKRLTQGGKGSVILQVKSLAEMGAPAQKKLPRGLLSAADSTLALGESDDDADVH
ncbi:MAG TPA: DNA recombination protein RmuC [Candidatus Saccharimonadia bacterium]|nr:DNA recombination protein RmuC [Candidatus Saccharimonadia bacterium]